MTGFDIALIVVLLVFAFLGLKHGSVWIAACLVGGFFGAFLVEYYRLPVAQMMGDFMGAKILASVVLFLAGVLVAVIPGWIVSKVAGLFCLGALDKVLGVVAGLVAGLIALTLTFMIIVPKFPSIEKSRSWRDSSVIRPVCEFLEDFFSHPSAQRERVTDKIKDAVSEQVTPLVDKTTDAIKDTSKNVSESVSDGTKALKDAVKGTK